MARYHLLCLYGLLTFRSFALAQSNNATVVEASVDDTTPVVDLNNNVVSTTPLPAQNTATFAAPTSQDPEGLRPVIQSSQTGLIIPSLITSASQPASSSPPDAIEPQPITTNFPETAVQPAETTPPSAEISKEPPSSVPAPTTPPAAAESSPAPVSQEPHTNVSQNPKTSVATPTSKSKAIPTEPAEQESGVLSASPIVASSAKSLDLPSTAQAASSTPSTTSSEPTTKSKTKKPKTSTTSGGSKTKSKGSSTKTSRSSSRTKSTVTPKPTSYSSSSSASKASKSETAKSKSSSKASKSDDDEPSFTFSPVTSTGTDGSRGPKASSTSTDSDLSSATRQFHYAPESESGFTGIATGSSGSSTSTIPFAFDPLSEDESVTSTQSGAPSQYGAAYAAPTASTTNSTSPQDQGTLMTLPSTTLTISALPSSGVLYGSLTIHANETVTQGRGVSAKTVAWQTDAEGRTAVVLRDAETTTTAYLPTSTKKTGLDDDEDEDEDEDENEDGMSEVTVGGKIVRIGGATLGAGGNETAMETGVAGVEGFEGSGVRVAMGWASAWVIVGVMGGMGMML